MEGITSAVVEEEEELAVDLRGPEEEAGNPMLRRSDTLMDEVLLGGSGTTSDSTGVREVEECGDLDCCLTTRDAGIVVRSFAPRTNGEDPEGD